MIDNSSSELVFLDQPDDTRRQSVTEIFLKEFFEIFRGKVAISIVLVVIGLLFVWVVTWALLCFN